MTRIFKSSHDVARLGVLTANGEPPRRLASLADLVRHMVCCEGLPDLPLRAAAAKVLDTLAAADPLPDLYLTDPVAFALPVAAGFVVQDEEPEVKGYDKFVQRKQGWVSRPIDPWGASQHVVQKVPGKKGQPKREGPAGLLEELREAWCINARSVADLDKDLPAQVAMLYGVAASLFGLVGEAPAKSSSTVDQASASAPSTVAEVPASGGGYIVGQAAAALPADAVVLAEWEKLSRAAGKKKPTADLMTRYACSADTIQRACTRARAAAAAVTAAAGTAANPFGKLTKRAA